MRWLAKLFDQIGPHHLCAAMDVESDHLRGDLEMSRACFKRFKHKRNRQRNQDRPSASLQCIIDKFRALLIRFNRCDMYILNAHYIAFAIINIRNII